VQTSDLSRKGIMGLLGPGRSTKHLEEEIKMKAKRPVIYADEQSLRMIKQDEAGLNRKRPVAEPL
jgi:hypothetical protein